MAGATTHILRASLRPRLYRDIEIDSGKSLYDLAGKSKRMAVVERIERAARKLEAAWEPNVGAPETYAV